MSPIQSALRVAHDAALDWAGRHPLVASTSGTALGLYGVLQKFITESQPIIAWTASVVGLIAGCYSLAAQIRKSKSNKE